ncbi:hypothetical protein Tco_1343688 [Tanacetum coccineum]
MSSITAQQTKLDLELVPKEKRLDIGKCKGRLNPRKIQREPTFQVVLDALALTPCYSIFLITADVPEVYMHQFWDSGRDFDVLPTDEEIVSFLRNLGHTGSLSGKTTSLDKLRLSRAQILWDKTLSWRNKIGIHTSKDDYLINTLRVVSAREETQIYGAILLESLTSPEMKKTKAYKNYLGFATGATPPKKARKFKKPASPKLTIVLISTEEPTGKSKRVKRPVKKSTQAPARGVVIRETLEIPVSKKKEKVDVARGKGIELLSDVALKEDAQFEEVQRKSMRDFHKTHPSGSGTVTKPTPSAVIIKPSVTNEGTGVKPGVPDVTEEESSESEAESWGNDEDDSNNDQDSGSKGSDQDKDKSESDQDINEEDKDDEEEVKDEIVKTPSNDSDDEDETKIVDKAEGDEDEEMDYTTSVLYDDVDIRLNEPVHTDKGFKTKVPVTSSSQSSDLAAKFLNFSDIPTTEANVHKTDENESKSESDQDINEEDKHDEEEVKDEIVKTPSNDSDDEDETKIANKAEGDKDEEMDYTTSLLYDDVDIRLNELVDTDKGFVQ